MEFDFHGLLGLLIVIGVTTGALTGMTGASGMSILISALLLAGIEIRHVIGLTFVITLVNAAISLGPYWRHGHVDGRSGLLVATPAIIAVLIGHYCSRLVDTSWLTGVMTVCLFVVGFRFLVAPKNSDLTRADNVAKPHTGLLVLFGCIAGFAMGVMGGGGAVFISVALIVVFQFETKTAIGTSILIMGAAAVPGVISHWLNATIKIHYAAAILASSIPAALAASLYANRIPAGVVKRLLGVYLVVISTVLFFRSLP